MSKLIDKKILEIHENLIKMSMLVEENIDIAIKSMASENFEMAKECDKKDDVIDDLEEVIERQIINIIATQNPRAHDLRLIFSILKIITDLERISDNGVNIADVVISMNGEKFIKPLVDLPYMGKLCKKMIHNSIDAFIDENVILAKETAMIDNEVDEIYVRVYNELLDAMNTYKDHKSQIINLLLIGRYLERIADHATNICERVIYLNSGDKVKF